MGVSLPRRRAKSAGEADVTLPALPASLEGWPLLEGTGPEDLHQAPVRTETEDGPGRARRVGTATWSTYNHRFPPLTHAQFGDWQVFVRDTLDHGSSRFTMPVWKPGATAPLPSRTVSLIGSALQHRGSFTYLTLKLSVHDY